MSESTESQKLKNVVDTLYEHVRNREIKHLSHSKMDVARVLNNSLSQRLPKMTNRILQGSCDSLCKTISFQCNDLVESLIQSQGQAAANNVDVHTIKSAIRLVFSRAFKPSDFNSPQEIARAKECHQAFLESIFQYMDIAVEDFQRQMTQQRGSSSVSQTRTTSQQHPNIPIVDFFRYRGFVPIENFEMPLDTPLEGDLEHDPDDQTDWSNYTRENILKKNQFLVDSDDEKEDMEDEEDEGDDEYDDDTKDGKERTEQEDDDNDEVSDPDTYGSDADANEEDDEDEYLEGEEDDDEEFELDGEDDEDDYKPRKKPTNNKPTSSSSSRPSNGSHHTASRTSSSSSSSTSGGKSESKERKQRSGRQDAHKTSSSSSSSSSSRSKSSKTKQTPSSSSSNSSTASNKSIQMPPQQQFPSGFAVPMNMNMGMMGMPSTASPMNMMNPQQPINPMAMNLHNPMNGMPPMHPQQRTPTMNFNQGMMPPPPPVLPSHMMGMMGPPMPMSLPQQHQQQTHQSLPMNDPRMIGLKMKK